ncbi:MAG TPA: hypothetical protein VFN74_24715, partial [Chloroflexota bacterium]|nr:hypothetical protein [Chloroflexota bacterium]
CLYALTAGGQGYTVDGQFAYQMATSVATDPSLTFARANAGTLRRWGPLLPATGVPFAWLGARLAQLAPLRDSVALDGRRLALYDWPAIGAASTGSAGELRVPVPFGTSGRLQAVRLVSYLSLAPGLPDRAPVADVILERANGSEVARTVLRAGQHSAEWAYAGASPRPAHAQPAIAGHWPGNPNGLLYWADLPLDAPLGEVRAVLLRYFSPTGRLHVRSIELRGTGESVALRGPLAWGEPEQLAFFTRFAFSFVNAPVVALTCALLVPLARQLGYPAAPSLALGLGAGVATPLWPYAKHDFAEPLAALCIVGAALLALRPGVPLRRLALAGTVAACAVGARYTAIWALPLLGLSLRSPRAIAAFSVVPMLAGLLALISGRLPAIWSGAAQGLGLGWLDFPLWNGLYGLLVSPGKGLLWYMPVVLLALAGLVPFVRAQRWRALLFLGLPLAYLLTYGSKGVWHGGGWGPRYLVPVIPLLVVVSLPALAWLFRGAPRLARWATVGLVVLSVGVQALGVFKHPNLYAVMFRDHVLPGLPEYGRQLGGPASGGYWRHFGGPEAGRQLARPPSGIDPSAPLRGLGYAYAESGPLRLSYVASEPHTLTLYACDWDHRQRRQRVRIELPRDATAIDLNHDFSACEYHQVSVTLPGTVALNVEAVESRDVPVISALFFESATPVLPPRGDGSWPGKVGRDGYALFAWNRGADVASYPSYVTPVEGGERVWIDTWQAELAETAPLYAPGFSPLLAHAWLLGADAIAIAAPGNEALLRRALGSPPWRYVHGLELHPPRPDFGLGLDLWPLLLRTQFGTHREVLVATALATLALGAALALSALWLAAMQRAAYRLEELEGPANSVRAVLVEAHGPQ